MLFKGLPFPKERNMEATSSADSILVETRGLVDLYTSTLESKGYRPIVIDAYRGAVEHFLAWSPNSDSVEIEEILIRRFADEHLSSCDCPGRVQRGKVIAKAALRRLLEILRTAGVLSPAPPNFSDAIHSELQTYIDYGASVCGLAAATLISRRQWIGRFLTHFFPTGDIVVSRLEPKEIRDFFTAQCHGYQPGTAQLVASVVRGYLRFRSVHYAEPVDTLMAAVPSAARWRLAALPECLSQAELTKLISAFENAGIQRQRDYAIVRCLVDLGLRSCEVAALRLDDIDWKNGTVIIRVGKSQRADVLPLPAVTGQAIADYLQRVRPATKSRAVFVRHRAPLDVPVDASVIRSVVRLAAARSGLSGRLHGPHRLRHSAATRMLNGGATLKEIADVLRHRSLDTTAIYAKVDWRRLSAIAQPWPGGAQ
jgi:site-specific recombinase XerD